MKLRTNDILFFGICAAVSLIALKLYAFLGGLHTATIIGSGLGLGFLVWKNHSLPRKLIMGIVIISALTCFMSLFWRPENAFGSLLRVILYSLQCMSCFIIGKSVVSLLPATKTKKVFLFFTYQTIVLGITDAYFRFFNPMFALFKTNNLVDISESRAYGLSIDTFHAFKFGSIMHNDANYTGIMFFSVLYLVLFSGIVQGKNKLILSILLMGLILLTLSRASIIISLVAIIIFLARSGYNWIKTVGTITIAAGVFSLFFYLPEISDLVNSDLSGKSKIEIFDVISKAFSDTSFNFFFGHGFIDGWYTYSYTHGAFAHVHIAILLGQIGLIGLIAYSYLYIRCSSKNALTAVFGILIFILGFSLYDPWEGVTYFCFGLMSMTSWRVKEKKTLHRKSYKSALKTYSSLSQGAIKNHQ